MRSMSLQWIGFNALDLFDGLAMKWLVLVNDLAMNWCWILILQWIDVSQWAWNELVLVKSLFKVSNIAKISDLFKVSKITEIDDLPKVGYITKINDLFKVRNITKINNLPKVSNMTKMNDYYNVLFMFWPYHKKIKNIMKCNGFTIWLLINVTSVDGILLMLNKNH